MRALASGVVALVLGFSAVCGAQRVVAPTPPMGWNSWDAYGTTVTEADTKANAATNWLSMNQSSRITCARLSAAVCVRESEMLLTPKFPAT